MKFKHMQAYMDCAYAFARCSPAERLQVGAVLVKGNRIISCGYNALPEALDGPCEDETGATRPEVRHAEENALRALVRSSESAVGSVMFVTHWCCLQCAIDVVDAGVRAVYYSQPFRTTEGRDYLEENGVAVIKFPEEVD